MKHLMIDRKNSGGILKRKDSTVNSGHLTVDI